MIYEAHGDVCRLGYLRLIACLADDFTPKSFDYLASLLHELVKQAEKPPEGAILTGIIASQVNARNYITLASETGMIDRKTQVRGMMGSIYSRLDSASKFHAIIEGRERPSHDGLLELSPVERAFFLHTLTYHDYPFLGEVILWSLQRQRFNRTDAMNAIMEDIYPEALTRALHTADPKRRPLIKKELDEAGTFKEKRQSFASKSEWIRSRQYAKYRHVAPPRLEWLVDLGILLREGRGKFAVNEGMLASIERFERVLRQPLKKLEDSLFEQIFPLLHEWEQASREEISQAFIEGYGRFVRDGFKTVKLDMLKLYTCYRLMEAGKLTTPSTVHQVFNNIALRYPDKVFVTPGPSGAVEIARIELATTEV